MSCSVPKSNSLQDNYFYVTNIQAENAKNTVCKDIKSMLGKFHGNGTTLEEMEIAKSLIAEAETLAFEAERLEINTIDTANLMDRIGVFLWRDNNIHKAKEYFYKALKILESKEKNNETNDAVACTCNHLGYVFYVEGNYVDAQENQQKALELFKNCYGDSHLVLADCYNALGLIEAKRNNFATAEMHYQMGLSCLVEYDNTDLLSTIYLNLGNLLNEKGDLKNAKEYFELSLIVETKIRKKSDNSVIANLAFKLGLISENLNLLEETKEYFEIALDNYIKMNETISQFSIVNCYMHLGDVCFSLKQFSEAVKHFKKAKELSEVINDKQDLEHLETMIRKCEGNLSGLSSKEIRNDQTNTVMTTTTRNTEKNALSKCTIS